MMGVMRPVGVETATETSTSSNWRMASSVHMALTFGKRRSVVATALMTKSLTESLKAPCSFGDFALRSARSLSSASISKSIET
jgi:hypothetical protein